MSYKLSDNVLARIVQIIQEGLLLGIDVVDLMRMIEVKVSADGSNLELTEDYVKQVAEHHKQLLEDAETIKSAQTAQQAGHSFIFEN
jgi:hypothetical protein